MEQRPTRRNEPIPKRRRRLAGSKLGQPRSIEERYPDISPQAAAVWHKMEQMDPPPPAVQAWLDWDERQKRAALALQLKQKEPPARAGGSRSSGSGDLPLAAGEQQRRGDADHDQGE